LKGKEKLASREKATEAIDAAVAPSSELASMGDVYIAKSLAGTGMPKSMKRTQIQT
jgi:hypothetical protein